MDFDVEREFSNCKGRWRGKTRCTGINCTTEINFDVFYRKKGAFHHSGSLRKIFGYTTYSHSSAQDTWKDTWCPGRNPHTGDAVRNLILLTVGLALSGQLFASPVPNNCSDGPAVCVDGPGTKFINSIEVYRECWNWQRTRECRSEANVNYCSALDSHAGCTEIGRKCLLSSLSGACLKEERTYQCGDAVSVENVELGRLHPYGSRR